MLQKILEMLKNLLGKKEQVIPQEIQKPISTNAQPAFNFDNIPASKPINTHIDIIEEDHSIDDIKHSNVLTVEQLQAFGVSQVSALKYIEPFNKTIQKFNIDTPLRLTHFMAQCLHESGNLRYSEELASGSAYEGRADLGNIHSGDGKLFKGRGLIEITGRLTYDKFGKYVGQDLTSGENPKKVSTDVELCCDSSGWFWDVFKKDKDGNNLNSMADKDLFLRITYFVNGGARGLADRIKNIKKAYKLFGLDNIDGRMKVIFDYIEKNLNPANRSTGLHTALFREVPDLKTLEELKKI